MCKAMLFRAVGLITAMVLLSLQPGCKTGSSTTPGASTTKVTLSEPEADAVLENIQGRLAFVAKCKVKYRFVEGSPQADKVYRVTVTLSGWVGTLADAPGSTFGAEGVASEKIPIPHSGSFTLEELKLANITEVKPDLTLLPKTAEFTVMEGAGQSGPFHIIGDKITCPVKVKEMYSVPK
jgi:hypothetical protein